MVMGGVRLVVALLLSLPSFETAASATCREAVGAQHAQELVRKCIEVSPATHPPCNADNSCELIIGEIRRGCGLLADDVPKFCRSYLGH